MTKTAVVALGGNALTRVGQSGTCDEMLANAAAMASAVHAVIEAGWRVVIVHGNGPQVGNLALQQESTALVPAQPLPLLSAMTQGLLGSLLARAIDLLRGPGTAVALVTHVTVDAGHLVIAGGGGGIPIHGGSLADAVIDKDRAAGLIARLLGAQALLLVTAVDRVMLDYGQPTQSALSTITAADAARYHAEGQFPPGSMGPKIEAALRFLTEGGDLAVITSPDLLAVTLSGTLTGTGTRSGTRIERTLAHAEWGR